MPGTAASVANEASNLGLMHGVDHGRRCAGPAERVADIDDLCDAATLAAELARHRETEQALGASGGERLARKSRLDVHRCRMGRRDRGDLVDARTQIRRVGGRRNASSRLDAARRIAYAKLLRHARDRRSADIHGCVPTMESSCLQSASTTIRVALELHQNLQFIVSFSEN